MPHIDTNMRRTTRLDKVALLLLLYWMVPCVMLMDTLQTTASPDPTTLINTHTSNSVVHPLVLRSHRSECGDQHVNFCANGGVCMFPQDSSEPSCICAASFSGPRCMILSDLSRSRAEVEQAVAITFGVAMMLLAVVVTAYCCIHRRCVKSSPLIKSAPTTSV